MYYLKGRGMIGTVVQMKDVDILHNYRHFRAEGTLGILYVSDPQCVVCGPLGFPAVLGGGAWLFQQ